MPRPELFTTAAEYEYALPPHRIAQHPLPDRAAAKLLVAGPVGALQDATVRDLPTLLPPDTLLVVNDTRVVPARLVFHKPTGARVEVLCLQPVEGGMASGLNQRTMARWWCRVGNAKKWKPEQNLALEGPAGPSLWATKGEPAGNAFDVRFSWTPPEKTFGEVLAALGSVPLPPYLNRAPNASDTARYQTVFAQQPGAVAAPTAGLHLTPEILAQLRQKGVQTCPVTLHVGAGTFQPLAEGPVRNHTMHAEEVAVPQEALEKLAAHTGPVVVVGTTSLRTIESLCWHARAVAAGSASAAKLAVPQWPQEKRSGAAILPLLRQLCDRLKAEGAARVEGKTQLMIAPGYAFQRAEGLLTNFHQPGSTLLVLTAAWLGTERWKAVYAHALANGYRFLSYGDANLYWR